MWAMFFCFWYLLSTVSTIQLINEIPKESKLGKMLWCLPAPYDTILCFAIAIVILLFGWVIAPIILCTSLVKKFPEAKAAFLNALKENTNE